MAKSKQVAEALEGAAALAEANTIIKRLVEDTELREAVGKALESGRAVYDRVSGGKKASKLLDDDRLQAEAADAIGHLRAAAAAFAGGKGGKKAAQSQSQSKRGGGLGRKLLVLGAGGAIAIVASEDLRSKVLDALFGAEEEFEYSPPPPAVSDAPGSPLSAV